MSKTSLRDSSRQKTCFSLFYTCSIIIFPPRWLKGGPCNWSSYFDNSLQSAADVNTNVHISSWWYKMSYIILWINSILRLATAHDTFLVNERYSRCFLRKEKLDWPSILWSWLTEWMLLEWRMLVNDPVSRRISSCCFSFFIALYILGGGCCCKAHHLDLLTSWSESKSTDPAAALKKTRLFRTAQLVRLARRIFFREDVNE